MKVLLASQFFPPVSGGEERHVLNLARRLAADGHEVSVLTQQTPGTEQFEVLPDGVRVHRALGVASRVGALSSSVERPHHPSVPDPWVTARISRVVANERPDVIHAHNWVVNSVIAARTAGTPVVLTMHDYGHVCATHRLMLNDVPCSGPEPMKCLKHASQYYDNVRGSFTAATLPLMRTWKDHRISEIMVVSQAVAEGNGLSAQSKVPWSVVPNFIPDDLADTAASEPIPELPTGDFILFVGDLSPEKGIEFLFEAHAALGAGRPPLVCIGKPTSAEPKSLPPNVLLFREWPHPKVLAAFARCSFAVLPSLWPDPCPTTVLEAMAMGKPVVSTAMGGMRDMIKDGSDGYLVAPGDVDALTERIRLLLANESLRETLGQAARQGSRAFTADSVIPRIEEVYRRVIR